MSVRSELAERLNIALRPLHMQVISGDSTDPAVKTYISARKTMAAARKAGLPLGAYIDQTYAEPGATPDLVREMLKISDLSGKCETVCEIGPGSGRFAEIIIDTLHPDAYEIYETARDWMPRLRQLPNVVVRKCDGHTLSPTPDASVDLVHAQKLFSYLEFYAVVGYLDEMARVVRPGGTVAFDVATEDCIDEATALAWAKNGTIYRPCPKEWTVEFMRRRGLTLCGSHFTPLPPGRAELLVFRRI